MFLRLAITIATLIVTAIGFQQTFEVSGWWTVPVVIVIGFLPFGSIINIVLLLIGAVFLLRAYGVMG